jgi:hypothetical protein
MPRFSGSVCLDRLPGQVPGLAYELGPSSSAGNMTPWAWIRSSSSMITWTRLLSSRTRVSAKSEASRSPREPSIVIRIQTIVHGYAIIAYHHSGFPSSPSKRVRRRSWDSVTRCSASAASSEERNLPMLALDGPLQGFYSGDEQLNGFCQGFITFCQSLNACVEIEAAVLCARRCRQSE